jgi:hypothetical protein
MIEASLALLKKAAIKNAKLISESSNNSKYTKITVNSLFGRKLSQCSEHFKAVGNT